MEDKQYTEELILLINTFKVEHGDLLNHCMLWDLCKNKIRSFSIMFCINKNKDKPKIAKLEESLQQASEQLKKNNSVETQQMYIKAKQNLEIAWESYTAGVKIRSREQWLQEGEKSTKYFLNLERKNIVNKSITSLQKDDGMVITDPDQLLEQQVLYYKKLYCIDEKVNVDDLNDFVKNVNSKTWDEHNQMVCEGELTQEECKEGT